MMYMKFVHLKELEKQNPSKYSMVKNSLSDNLNNDCVHQELIRYAMFLKELNDFCKTSDQMPCESQFLVIIT